MANMKQHSAKLFLLEEQICKINNTKTNPRRRGFLFYQYLANYYRIAAQNHNILNKTKTEAIKFLTKSPIDIDYLARVITYYDLIKDQRISLNQIIKHYNTTFKPEAEKYLFKKFKINFQLVKLEDLLFLELSPPFQ